MSRQGKIEIFRGLNKKQFFFRVKSGNGKIVAQSEGYSSRAKCCLGIEAAMKVFQGDDYCALRIVEVNR